MFCEESKQLIDIDLFALAAKYYSLSSLGVCTPLEHVLEALRGDNQGRTGIFTFVYKFFLIHYRICGVLVSQSGLMGFFPTCFSLWFSFVLG